MILTVPATPAFIFQLPAVGFLEGRRDHEPDRNPVVSTFTTLLAIKNPLESPPVFLRLLQGNDQRAHRWITRFVPAISCKSHLTLFLGGRDQPESVAILRGSAARKARSRR